jgi:hypothetical protein
VRCQIIWTKGNLNRAVDHSSTYRSVGKLKEKRAQEVGEELNSVISSSIMRNQIMVKR